MPPPDRQMPVPLGCPAECSHGREASVSLTLVEADYQASTKTPRMGLEEEWQYHLGLRTSFRSHRDRLSARAHRDRSGAVTSWSIHVR